MSFHDISLPSFLEVFICSVPEFSTSSVVSNSGREIRSSDRDYSMLKFFIRQARLSCTEFNQFNNFFRGRAGKRFSFRFYDRSDFAANKSLIGIGDGHTKEFQLYKIYDDPVNPYRRKITKPLRDKMSIYVNNQPVKAGINYLTGGIIFDIAPAMDDKIFADFEFDVPVRFNLDQFGYSFMPDGSIELSEIELIEVYE